MPNNNVLTVERIARAIWAIRRVDEDRCDMELEDMGESHAVWREARAIHALLAAHPGQPDCWCETCRPITLTDMRMVLCPTCGNKRCPHATDHRNACTDSNDPGQPGSSCEHVIPIGQSQPPDAIARSKRILGLVDAYHENPTRDTRTALRVALMDEFQPEPRAEVTDDDIITACDAHGITLPVEAIESATALVNHFTARAGARQ
ncbi:hypothetical protein ACN8ZM_40340 (plasmid) [Burkholderia aenigmatica]|uniref:hypothetical protein n=1 Tax=Burkholderia aenigmatica TaxID=2015348 RepID=UPI003B439140